MMGPGYDGGPPADRDHGHPPVNDAGYPMDRDVGGMSPGQGRQNGGSYATLSGRPPASPAPSGGERDWDRDVESRQSDERNRSRQRNGRTASGQLRICKKCGEPLTGQFVRALDGTFHLDCFRCRDCGQIVASKFFPADDENGEGQYPLCETDYFRRLGLLCYECGGALRGSYITALDRKYHVDHFTCSLCPTVFGAQDSYYEHDGQVYCHYHYSTQFAQRCNGCQTAILKQFVEIFRNGQNQHWHPECYMIHKFWNVRLSPPSDTPKAPEETDDPDTRTQIRKEEEKMEDKVFRIWSVLSTFEESSAACISDMLLHVSNGAYVDGVLVAKKFIFHVDMLFQSADKLDATMARLEMKGLSYGREAKLLCKKIVAFFSLLSKAQDKTSRKLGVTQELLSLVTGLAHYLKLLIRTCLQGALRIEKERNTSEGLYQFLEDLDDLEALKSDDARLQVATGAAGMARLSANDSDQCTLCRKPIEDECVKNGENRWHVACVGCSHCGRELGNNLNEVLLNTQSNKIFCRNCMAPSPEASSAFERVTKLQQYVFLLKVALARLLEILRSNGALPRSSEDADAGGDGRISGDKDSATGRSDIRSRSQGAGEREHQRESSYENTLADVRRLRSTRLDKHLSSSFRKARTSRIMDGFDGASIRPGSAGADGGAGTGRGLHIVEDRDDEGTTDRMMGNQDALTLDDIPRIVAAEQAREQRPNGFGRQELFRSPATEPNFKTSDQTGYSSGRDMDMRPGGGEPSPQRGGRKYFSELSGLEYFIVRHLAVLTMQPMIEAEFSLDELLGFIESRKQANFWNRFGKAFKNDTKKNTKKKGVFGVPLEVIVERDGADSTDGVGPGTLRIPAIVDDIVSTMRKMDLSVEGVFRKNGNIKKLNELVERIDREGCDNVNLNEQNVVQVAALLKRYLRELPDPLLTHKLYRLWLAAAKVPDEEKRRQCLHLTCCLLPKCHRDCLEILFCFLKWAGSFHQVDDESGSKMDIKNLATVIAPNILYMNSKVPALDSDPMFAIIAVETLINYIEEMCLVPGDLIDVLHDSTLFSNNGDITTKEILKRLGDRSMNGQARSYGDVSELVNRHEASARPQARRVETDPAVWQDERTVRPIQDPLPPPQAPFSNPNQGSPQKWRNPDEPQGHPSPYAPDFEESPMPGPDGQRREWRNSGWGKGNNNSNNPSLGVTGTS